MAYNEYLSGSEMVLSVAPTAPERAGTDPALPTTPTDIATQVADCAKLGATVASVYGWTADGEPSTTALPAVAAAIRDQTSDVAVEYTVSPQCYLGDYLDVLDTPPHPDLAQVRLTPTQYRRRDTMRRSRSEVDRLIGELHDRSIKPNLLIRNGRDIQELYRLLESDTVRSPVVTIKIGARNGTVATPLLLLGLLDALPPSATTLVAATGPNQYPLTTQAIFLGASVRTGMGDNRYLSVSEPVEHNMQLVQRAVQTVYHSERSIADIETTGVELELDSRSSTPSEAQ